MINMMGDVTIDQKKNSFNWLKEMRIILFLIIFLTWTEPVLVIVRLAQNGCLLTLLKKNRKNPYKNIEEKGGHFTRIDKLRIARDIANGMLHLSNKKVQ